jgi:hypothetical protein
VLLVRSTSYHFLAAGKDISHPNDTTELELHRIHGARRRFFCSATAAPSSSQKNQHKTKTGTRRSNIQRKTTPKQLSYKGNYDTRSKPSNSKTRQGSSNRIHKHNNNTTQFGCGSSRYDNINDIRVRSSIASSIVYEWEDSDDRSESLLVSNNWAGGTAARADSDGDTRRRSSNNNSFQLDRFRDKQEEFSDSLEDYRLFWYPKSGKQQQHSDDKSRANDSSSSSSSSSSDLRTALIFEHPNPNENFPWLDLSWENIVESEDLFRRVCTSHHDLFVSCASYLTELSEMNQHQHQGQGQIHHRNHDPNRLKHYSTDDSDEDGTEEYYNIDNDDWTEQDLLRVDCEDLLTKILPSWERLRRERALLVENYRPQEENDEDDSPSPREQHVSPLDEINQESIAHVTTKKDTAAPDVSYKNNQWVGWLKKMITGDDHDIRDASGEPFERVTAHSDPECAPNHYHYTKLVGRMYFHYLPLERHNRSNPFHCYSKSEKEEGIDREQEDDGGDSDSEVGGDSHNAHYKNPYQKAMAAWEDKRFEILGNRAEQMQYAVDQSLLPLTPNRNNSGTVPSKPQHHRDHDDDIADVSDRVLTDKIVRLLIRSYLDIESLSAAQQAERVYHRHPNHRKRLLWYVTMCYLKVITSNNKELARAASASISVSNNTRSSGTSKNNKLQKELFLQQNQESSTAAQRICELVSSKHAKEAREFQHCSTIAFEALAKLPQYGRRGLKGYYDRVHSLGILKFGPKVWEALLHGESNVHQTQAHGDRSHDNSSSSRRRKRNTNRKTPLDASSSSSLSLLDKPSHEVQPTTKPHIDLSQTLHSKDHKIINFLIQIYSNEDKDLHRALRLVNVSLDLYSPHDLKESLDRSTFHKLLRKLSEQKRKASIEQQKKQEQNSLSSYGSESGSNNKSKEFDIALGILDSMVSDETWFPNEETFRILFSLIPYSENPGRNAERLRSKLEACRFLSDLSKANHRPTRSHTSGGEGNSGFASLGSPHLLHPLEASTLTLRAWLQTLQQHGGVLPPSETNPSQRALAILRAMKVGSSSLFPALLNKIHNESGINEDARGEPFRGGNINSPPTAALYSLALEVCARDAGSPRATLDAALEIFGFLQTDGLLLKGNACLALLGVLANFSGGSTSGNEDLLLARAKATKKVCEALIDEDPFYGQNQPPVLQFLQKQASYLRLRHPDLYEEHLAELGLFDDIGDESDSGSIAVTKMASTKSQTDKEDDTVIEGLGGGGESTPKA